MTEITSLAETGTRRRTVVAAAAWSIPVIAMAVAAPAASASGTVCGPDQLYSLTAHIGDPDRVTSISAAPGVWKIQKDSTLGYPITFTNMGPATMPAGGKFQIWMPVASVASAHGVAVGAMWTSLTVTSLDPAVVFSGPAITDGGVDVNGFQWKIYEFTLDVPLVANQSFTVNCLMATGPATATPDSGTTNFTVSLRTRVYAGTAMCNQATADSLDVSGASFTLRFQ
ncbi:hypothetical protein [Arthrobacter sp. A2-55]|uniref:hypothetical protein n=1 Tax=Arthrobacter sp. A2-55 TaxID=2897337 RepID=UPI0021CDA9E7|nr:hypothetical protein [Arthrobacter sp. A2-55]MCU6481409.1 hypothetical protein [Arthrobacter sp. A2-55]